MYILTFAEEKDWFSGKKKKKKKDICVSDHNAEIYACSEALA